MASPRTASSSALLSLSAGTENVTESPQTATLKQRRLKSEHHEHFTLSEDEAKYCCNYCRTKYKKIGGVTSNMKRHLERQHSSVINGGGSESCSVKRFLQSNESQQVEVDLRDLAYLTGNQETPQDENFKSDIYEHFTLSQDETKYCCNYCSVKYNNRGSVTSSLKRHLEKQHSSNMIDEGEGSDCSESSSETGKHFLLSEESPKVSLVDQTYLTDNQQSPLYKRKLKSELHEHFTFFEDDAKYCCNYCSTNYKKIGGVTSNMKRHLKNKHLSILNGENYESSSEKHFLWSKENQQLNVTSDLTYLTDNQQILLDQEIKSEVFEYFTLSEDEAKYCCNYCSTKYKNTRGVTCNMKRHLEKQHSSVINGESSESSSVKRFILRSIKESQQVNVIHPTHVNERKRSPLSRRKLKSDFYEHFTLCEDEVNYCCNYCRTKYKSAAGVTSNMKRHLEKEHSSVINIEGSESSSVKRFRRSKESQQVPKINPDSLRKVLAEFILLTDQQFEIVEDESFRKLLHLLSPDMSIPDRMSIHSEVTSLFQAEKSQLKMKLHSIPGKVSFILDCGTSLNQWPKQGIIVQAVDLNWELFTVPLDLTVLEGPHTGNNLATAFMTVLEDFGLQEKVHSITTDNSNDMDTFFVNFQQIMNERGLIFDPCNFRVRCLAHTLNLCCQDSLKSLQDNFEDTNIADGSQVPILSKLHKSIEFVQGSPQRREEFKRQSTALNCQQKELILDDGTCWNSTYLMMERALELRMPLDWTLRTEQELLRWVLTNEEWAIIEAMRTFLKPFKEMTVLMSKQDFPTISICALVYSQLLTHLEKYKIDQKGKLKANNPDTDIQYPKWLQEVSDLASKKLDSYYPSSDGLSYVIGTLLDPRCKMDWFRLVGFSSDTLTQYLSQVKQYWKENYKPLVDMEQNLTDELEFDLFMQLQGQREKQSKAGKKDELEKYLGESVVRAVNMKTGVLGWWRNHSEDYPNLSKMARDFLSSSGTGVPVERLFSFGSDLLGRCRQRMKPDKAKECICTKGWLQSKSQAKFKEQLCFSVSEKMLGGDLVTIENR